MRELYGTDLKQQEGMLSRGLHEMRRELAALRGKLVELEKQEQQQIGALTFVRELINLQEGDEVESSAPSDE